MVIDEGTEVCRLYCVTCGTVLDKVVLVVGYDHLKGTRIFHVDLVCSNKKWWHLFHRIEPTSYCEL